MTKAVACYSFLSLAVCSLPFESGMKCGNFILIPKDETSKQFPATRNKKRVTSNEERFFASL
jgi:hypothetical protein